MLVLPPPGYLTLDEMFARVGQEIYGVAWTGKEPAAVADLPPGYWWHPGKLLSLDEVFPPNDVLDASLHQRVDANESAFRYQTVVKRVIDLCRHGAYIPYSLEPNGEFTLIDEKGINTEAFQTLLWYPGAQKRNQLYFLACDDDDLTETPSPVNTAGPVVDEPMEQESQEHEQQQDRPACPEPTRREASKHATKTMHDKWFELAHKHWLSGDGTRPGRKQIAKMIADDPEAAHPRTGKHPNWQTVLRELNRSQPGWLEKISGDFEGKIFAHHKSL